MENEQQSNPDAKQPPVYTLKIKGHLGQQWMNWFDGLAVTLEEDGNTLLSGHVSDQSALHGILKKIRDLGMPLLSVNSTDSNQTFTADTDEVKGDL
jgi:hypothetical protein